MAKIFNCSNCYDAWSTVSEYLLDENFIHNTVIDINNCDDFTNLKLWEQNFCPSSITGNNKHRLTNIINTIFPYKLASRISNREELYKSYLTLYNRSRKIRNQKWGTYFERLINFPNSSKSGIGFNQLENAICSLNGNSKAKNYITFHLTSVNIESNVRPIGAPCWQFSEIIKNSNQTLDLIAVYRNHDYFYKALGNFIGLSKLLLYICEQTNRQPGKLIIHSTHAYYNSSKLNFRKLISSGNN